MWFQVVDPSPGSGTGQLEGLLLSSRSRGRDGSESVPGRKTFSKPDYTLSVSAIAGTFILTLSIRVLCPVAVPKLKTLRWVLRFGEAKSS